MLELGFRKYDLVWVEGKSAAWRYPGEISEFKDYAPLVEEQPYDRFFKRNIAPAAEEEQPAATIVAPLEKKQKPLTASELLKARRVAITMPANRSSAASLIVPQRKQPIEEPEITRQEEVVDHLPKVKETAPEEIPVSIQHSSYLPGAVHTPPPKNEPVLRDDGGDEELIPLTQIPPKPFRGDYTGVLQYTGVAAALVSLLMVGILIGKGMGTNYTAPPPAVNEQPSRIAELKKKLMAAPIAEPEEVVPDHVDIKASIATIPAKGSDASIKKDIGVRTSYKTPASFPEAGNGEKIESVKGSTTPDPGKTTTDNADLASKVSVSLNDYKVNLFGGIDGIEVTVTNGAAVPVAEAVVELRYILSNKNKKHISETIRFRDLKPGESMTLTGPKSAHGIKLEYSLVSAR
jgi:hypothetical protein